MYSKFGRDMKIQFVTKFYSLKHLTHLRCQELNESRKLEKEKFNSIL